MHHTTISKKLAESTIVFAFDNSNYFSFNWITTLKTQVKDGSDNIKELSF